MVKRYRGLRQAEVVLDLLHDGDYKSALRSVDWIRLDSGALHGRAGEF